MNELARHPQRRGGRRSKRPQHILCGRESCDRPRANGSRHCSFICRKLDEELSAAQRVCQAVGSHGLSAQVWAAAVAVSDAWSEYRRLADELGATARGVGITDEQWGAIRRGMHGNHPVVMTSGTTKEVG